MADKRSTRARNSRFDRIVNEPEQYFAEARERAGQQVDRQIAREHAADRPRRRAGFRRNDEPSDG